MLKIRLNSMKYILVESIHSLGSCVTISIFVYRTIEQLFEIFIKPCAYTEMPVFYI